MLTGLASANFLATAVWEPPVFDRTLEDVEFASRNRNDNIQYKGMQGFEAWNRLTNNMYYLAQALTSVGFPVTINVKMDWNKFSLATPSIVNQIKSEIQKLLDIAALQKEVPDLPYTHYEKINAIEKITSELKHFVDDKSLSKFQLGTFYIGLEGILI